MGDELGLGKGIDAALADELAELRLDHRLTARHRSPQYREPTVCPLREVTTFSAEMEVGENDCVRVD
jgi:hypothetical protein